MNGSKFVELLERLELPGSEKLIPADYDWIFLQNDNLSRFWSWISDNFNKSDLLTDQELKDYEELVENGLTLSPEQMKQMEGHFGGLSIGAANICAALTVDDETVEEKEEKKDELKMLQQRKDHIMLQKMEIRDRIERRKENMKHLEISLEMENKKLQPVLSELSKTKKELFTLLQETVKTFENFSNPKGSPAFLSQISLSHWHEEEEKFQTVLKKYIDRQFAEDMQEFADTENNSDLLFESAPMTTNSIRGAKHEKFMNDSNELNRITKMLEQATIDDALVDIDKRRKEAEIEETSKVLKMVSDKAFPTSSTILAEQTKECEELIEAHMQDLNHQIECIKEKAAVIARTERTNTLLSNYRAKIQRQEYFLSKQEEVIEEFAGQLARYDVFKIIFDLEKEKILENFSLFLKLGTSLCTEEKNLLHGQNTLDEMFRKWRENNSVHSRRELSLLTRLMPPPITADTKCSHSIDSTEKEYNSLQESQMITIQNLLKMCSMMKHCLFGGDKLPGRLPSSWLNSEMAEEQRKLEQDLWDFQQEMMVVFKDIQFKKQKKSLELH